jgi:hypothetical protein
MAQIRVILQGSQLCLIASSFLILGAFNKSAGTSLKAASTSVAEVA